MTGLRKPEPTEPLLLERGHGFTVILGGHLCSLTHSFCFSDVTVSCDSSSKLPSFLLPPLLTVLLPAAGDLESSLPEGPSWGQPALLVAAYGPNLSMSTAKNTGTPALSLSQSVDSKSLHLHCVNREFLIIIKKKNSGGLKWLGIKK